MQITEKVTSGIFLDKWFWFSSFESVQTEERKRGWILVQIARLHTMNFVAQ